MALYTVLDEIEIQSILLPYGIKKPSTFKVLSGGSENTNYLLQFENKGYVLTLCEQKSTKEANALASLLEYLKQNNFATSKLIKTIKGDLTSEWKGKPVVLKEFIEGDIVQDLSKNILLYLGRELARLHQIKAPANLPHKVAFGIEHFDEIKVYAAESTFYTWLKQSQGYIESNITDHLPKSLIHSDIFYNNIITDIEKEQAVIMDFEEACYYYRIFDIGMMLIGCCSEGPSLNLSKAGYLLEGYQQETPLLESEKKALKAFAVYAATATAFWRHQNFNHVNIIPARKDDYLVMQNLANSIKKLPEHFIINLLT
jgi:homoserine kinase type II